MIGSLIFTCWGGKGRGKGGMEGGGAGASWEKRGKKGRLNKKDLEEEGLG